MRDDHKNSYYYIQLAMSVRNLTTDQTKPDMDINATSLNAQSLDVDILNVTKATTTQDFGISSTATVTTTAGRVVFTNLPEILSQSVQAVTLASTDITGSSVILVVYFSLNTAQGRLLRVGINSIQSGQASIYFSNFSNTTFNISGSAGFEYLIL